MINSVSNVNNVQTEKKTKFKNKGFIRAEAATLPIVAANSVVSKKLLSGMQNVSKLSHEDSVQLIKAAQKGLEETGLKDKGVKTFMLKSVDLNLCKGKNGNVDQILNLLETSKKDKKALKAIRTELETNKILKKVFDKIGDGKYKDELLDSTTSAYSYIFKSGSNAAYLPKAKKIILPDKTLQTSVFHEMGHALNGTGGKALKMLQKVRPLAVLIPPVVLAVSLLNKRKTDEKPSENKVVNFFDGIKKNAGKITALSMLPMVLEEGIASFRGTKIVSNLVKNGQLSKDLQKKILVTNATGFASYALKLGATVLATKLAIKLKDKIQENYEVKKQQKLELKAQKKAEAEALKNAQNN